MVQTTDQTKTVSAKPSQIVQRSTQEYAATSTKTTEHGTGFWDRAKTYSYSMGNYADKFQAIAEGFGETDYYDTEGNTL